MDYAQEVGMRPKRLYNDNRYFIPDGWVKRPNVTHLVDYFDGSEEVWNHLPVEVLYDEAPPAKRSTSVSITTIGRPDKPSNAAPAATPPHSVDNSTTKASAKPLVNSPAQSPAKPPGKTPAKSPAKSPAKTRGRPPGKPPTPKKKRTRTSARSARLAAEAVDISARNDRMSSGDEDDYGLDNDAESVADNIIDDAKMKTMKPPVMRGILLISP
ncbi:hypothetical protein F442_19131 [Phytophthora nicotianae P10297]|uniref:Uncharacterized protein n=1 Tax=Phytophthora nicotianae P10297 TaxID=1317064 RepID=W2YAQ4_PHYNI|nr:hypothetical protein F442_19131 [Phytophthora nicotianae P10297]